MYLSSLTIVFITLRYSTNQSQQFESHQLNCNVRPISEDQYKYIFLCGKSPDLNLSNISRIETARFTLSTSWRPYCRRKHVQYNHYKKMQSESTHNQQFSVGFNRFGKTTAKSRDLCYSNQHSEHLSVGFNRFGKQLQNRSIMPFKSTE